jgi:hypothetical protein
MVQVTRARQGTSLKELTNSTARNNTSKLYGAVFRNKAKIEGEGQNQNWPIFVEIHLGDTQKELVS